MRYLLLCLLSMMAASTLAARQRLTLLSPNGGERLRAGDTVTVGVGLTGLLDSTTIRRELSADGGVTFAPLAEFVRAFGGNARIWDVATGNLLARLPHSCGVLTVRYLPGCEQLLAGTRYCAEVVLWTPYLSIADTSDASFSIFAPRKSVADIDFGRVPIDRRRDSTLAGYICNRDSRPMIVHEMTFPDDDYAEGIRSTQSSAASELSSQVSNRR